MYSVIIHEAFQGVEARGDMALKTGDNPLKKGGKNCDSSNSFFSVVKMTLIPDTFSLKHLQFMVLLKNSFLRKKVNNNKFY